MAQLHDRTEGWAAGVQLAALSLRGNPDPAGFLRTFSGSHRYVMDYLTEEVLARQTDDVVRFLLETSVLERLCGPVCDAVTRRTDGRETLERLDAAGLFLIPWTKNAGGGATISCSPTCCGFACSASVAFYLHRRALQETAAACLAVR